MEKGEKRKKQKADKAGNTRNAKKKFLILAGHICFLVYLIVLLYLVFGLDRVEHREYHYNLVLFDEITRFFKYRNIVGNRVFVLNIMGNVLGFVPFGFWLPFLGKDMKNIGLITLVTFEFSLFIELVQLIFKIGSFDVDDLFLNTLGGFLGCLIYYVWKYFYKKNS